MSNKKKSLLGIVISKKMNKTSTIIVTRYIKHPVYKKFILKKKKYHVHDEYNITKIGDKVQIEECRPISKIKNWKIKKIFNKI